MVAPVLLLILFATMYMGIALDNYLVLTAAAGQGALEMAGASGGSNPYTETTAVISAASQNLNTAKITQAVTVGGSSCTSDATCKTLLTAGSTVVLTLTYPCNLTFLGYSFGGSPCTLTAQSAAVVQ
jgi:hypothetical protein